MQAHGRQTRAGRQLVEWAVSDHRFLGWSCVSLWKRKGGCVLWLDGRLGLHQLVFGGEEELIMCCRSLCKLGRGGCYQHWAKVKESCPFHDIEKAYPRVCRSALGNFCLVGVASLLC